MTQAPGGTKTTAISRHAARKERTRRDLYDAAMNLFDARGYDGVTVEDICAAGGAAKATFFLHYPTKAALIHEFTREMTARLGRDLTGRDQAAADDLHRVFAVLLDEWRTHGPVMRQMLREFVAEPDAVKAGLESGADLARLFAGIVRKGQSRGEFRRDIAPELAAGALWSTSAMIMTYWSQEGDRLDVEEAHAQIVTLVLNGLTKDRNKTGAARPARRTRARGKARAYLKE